MAAMLLLAAACAPQVLEAAPTPAAHVFENPQAEINTHAILALLSKEDPTHAHWVDYFGGSVDIDGDVLVAGAPEWGRPSGEGIGAAYVFRRSPDGEWLLETTLTASDRDDGFQYDQHFGEVIAIQDGVIAVGAPGYDDVQAGDNIGAVYLYEYDDGAWMETGKLTSSRKTPGAKMGSGLAFDGNLIAVSGAPEAGTISIFQRQAGGWREQAQVAVPVSPDGEPGYVLLDLYGDTLAFSTVTMYPLDENDVASVLRRTGSVILFERTGDEWKQSFQTAPQEASLYRMYDGPYGIPVALGGEAGRASWLAVGKSGFPESGREQGSVAIFERGDRGWELRGELRLAPREAVPGALWLSREDPEDPGATFFGADVEIEDNRLAVVSTFANSVYVFERQESGWAYRFRLIPEYHDDFQRRTVAISGNRLLIGSPGELGGGSAFVFDLAR